MRLYVGTYKNYAEGSLKGGWIDLPAEKSEIDRFIKEVVGIGPDNEEPMIQDWEFGLEGVIHESSNIYDLNVLATLWDELDSYEQEAVEAYFNDGYYDGLCEVGNIIKQADKIPYYDYDFVGIENMRGSSNAELYGRTRAESNGLTDLLDERGVEYCFDYEKYGRNAERNEDVALFDDGYLYTNNDVNLNFYDWEELVAFAGLEDDEEEERLYIANESEMESAASNLYDGGWRYGDREEFIDELEEDEEEEE